MKKPTKSDTTLVTFLLDRTGSMGNCKTATIEAFNGYLDGLTDPGIKFTLVTFDSQSLDKVCVDVAPKNAIRLNAQNYQPRAATPLIDSAFTTIKAVEKKIAEQPKSKVIVCIQTDGEENCSTEHSWEELNALIAEKTKAGWEFNFMGAGIDSYQQAAKMGVTVANTVSYDHLDAAKTRTTFMNRAAVHTAYAAGLASNTAFTADQKMAAGDRFDPAMMANTTGISAVAKALDLTEKPKSDDLDLTA